MIILGVDPGSRITGYGILERKDKKLIFITSGCIKPPSKVKTFPERLHFIYEKLNTIIKDFSPEMLALEDIFVAKDPRAAIKLGQVRGAIMVAAKNHGLEIAEYPPTTVKQALVGNGRADKNQVARMVEIILNIKAPKCRDESDALAAAICHGHTVGGIR